MLKYILVMMVCLVVYSTPIKGQEEKMIPPNLPGIQDRVPTMPEIQEPMGRPYGQIFQMMKQMMCNDTEVVNSYIKDKFCEQPYTYGLNNNMKGVSSMMTIVYVNPMSRTFSIVEHSAAGMSCILGQGMTFEYLDQDLLNMQKPF